MITLIEGKYEEAKSYYEIMTQKDYYEFRIAYTSDNEVFRELDRFIWESKHYNIRFKNQYAGPVLIDLTDWNSNETNDYFKAFMYYLKDHPCLECTFIVENLCETKFLEVLNSFFKIDVVKLDIRKAVESKKRIGFYIEEGDSGNVRG